MLESGSSGSETGSGGGEGSLRRQADTFQCVSHKLALVFIIEIKYNYSKLRKPQKNEEKCKQQLELF